MIPVNGGELAYYRLGRGPDVVAIHGWPLHAATWRNVAAHLANDVTLHLFDLPGSGSTRWHDELAFDRYAAAVREGIDALGLDRYALLAHDSGGIVARQLAATDPRVHRLILADTEIPGHRGALLGAMLVAAKLPFFGSLLRMLLSVPALRRSSLAYGACFTDPRHVDGEFARLFIAPMRDPRITDAQLTLLRSFRHDVVDALAGLHGKITAPTLCIWGENDPFFPIAKARAMLSQFEGGATLVELPGAKLFSHEDHAAAFATHARTFLTANAEPPASVRTRAAEDALDVG